MPNRHQKNAQALLLALLRERRATIEAGAASPGARMRGAIVELQAEIEALQRALADEDRLADEAERRQLASA